MKKPEKIYSTACSTYRLSTGGECGLLKTPGHWIVVDITESNILQYDSMKASIKHHQIPLDQLTSAPRKDWQVFD